MSARKEAEFSAESLKRIKQDVYQRAGLVTAELPVRSKRTRRNLGRKAGIAASVVLALVVAAGAANASGWIDLSRVLGYIGADRVGLLKSINQSSEDQGIVMNVLGAVRDGESAEIYVSLQDKAGHRIDPTLDIYDFFVEGASSHNAQTIHYDSRTGQATVRFLVTGKMQNRMTLRITSFLRGAHKNEHYDPRLDLTRLLKSQPSQSHEVLKNLDGVGGMGGPKMLEAKETDELHVLPLNKMSVPLPGMDWIKISNIGFVDDKLHIQLNREGKMAAYNHGYFYFSEKEASAETNYEYSISRGLYKHADGSRAGDYEEYVFDISSIEQLEELKLQGYFVEYEEWIQGDWEVTFDLEQVSKKLEGKTKFDWEGAQVHEVEVSPLGIILKGSNFDNIDWTNPDLIQKLGLVVHFKDGTEIPATSGFIQHDEGPVKWIASEALSVNDVTSISLNGQSIIVQ